jgi:hypothetical protein
MQPDASPNWSILISALIVAIGWFVVSTLNARRDRKNKLREVRIQYLIDAYRNLSDSSQRPLDPSAKYFRQIEAAVSDIQLFGTPSQIEKVKQMVVGYSKTGMGDLDPILNDLRDNLRSELSLKPISDNVTWLRVEGVPKGPVNQKK